MILMGCALTCFVGVTRCNATRRLCHRPRNRSSPPPQALFRKRYEGVLDPGSGRTECMFQPSSDPDNTINVPSRGVHRHPLSLSLKG